MLYQSQSNRPKNQSTTSAGLQDSQDRITPTTIDSRISRMITPSGEPPRNLFTRSDILHCSAASLPGR